MTDTPEQTGKGAPQAPSEAAKVEKDAEGQFVGTQHGGKSDGVVSAKPTAITGSEDATVHKWNPDKKDPPADWDANFNLDAPDKS